MKYTLLSIICASVLLVGCGSTNPAPQASLEKAGMSVNQLLEKKNKEDRNKKNAKEFYRLLISEHDYDGAEKYMGTYIQHDPLVVGNGIAPLKEFLTTDPRFKNRPKGFKIEYSMVMADGDFIYFQLRKELAGKADEKGLVQHIFRFSDDGKIEEHWTTVNFVNTKTSLNPHPLY
ncbi:MAG: putative SnoaL-like aldol condensation-catalyzing enzyme [Sulfurimonas sp.]|jgi:predicted SnoaL-like aldol condensation-catalyzing enzyme